MNISIACEQHGRPLLRNPPPPHPHHPGQADWTRKRSCTPLLKEEKWRLEPTLKRARLHDRSVKMEDIMKWRIENYNLEKRPRKLNSWVANRPKEEYQADLFFFDDLRQRAKVQTGKLKDAGGLRSRAVGRRYLQQEDCGCSNRAEKSKEDLGAALDKASKQMGGGGSQTCYTRTRSPG